MFGAFVDKPVAVSYMQGNGGPRGWPRKFSTSCFKTTIIYTYIDYTFVDNVQNHFKSTEFSICSPTVHICFMFTR